MEKDCIFCQIVEGDIPSHKVYEDEETLAFLDTHPVNPGHTLVVPKKHHRNILDMPEDVMMPLMETLKKVAHAIKASTEAGGISLRMNNEPAGGQDVFHAHFHVIPRHEEDGLENWPQDEYGEGEAEEIAREIRKKL